MDPSDASKLNLSEIPTIWSDIAEAHVEGPRARHAQERIVKRYGPAVLRFLFVLVKDVEAASDLFQQFAKGLVEGKLRRADPSRGKFRYYLKTTLINLFHDYCRNRHNNPVRYTSDLPDSIATEDSALHESDAQFLAIWRNELLKMAFDALQEFERITKRPYHSVLELRLRHADARTSELVQRYEEQTGQSLSEARMRRLLYEARRHFSDQLLRLVEETLHNPGLVEVEDELIELGLQTYCREAIQRRRLG